MEKQCEYCNKAFTAKRSSAQYCSDSCKTLACRSRKAAEKATALYLARKKEAEDLLVKKKLEMKEKHEAKKLLMKEEQASKNRLISDIIFSLKANALTREESQEIESNLVESQIGKEIPPDENKISPQKTKEVLSPFELWDIERKRKLAREAELFRYKCLGEITAVLLFKIGEWIFPKKS